MAQAKPIEQLMFRHIVHHRLRITLALLCIAALPVVLWWLGIERHPPPSEVFASGVLTVGIDPSTPPFGYLDADGQYAGIDIDLAYLLAERLGLRVAFVPLSYDGIYDAVVTGRVDVALGATSVDTTRANSDTRYTWGYFDDGLLLVSPPDAPLRAGADLAHRTVAVEYGGMGDVEARRWTRRVHGVSIIPHPTTADALEAVRAGTAQAAIADAVSVHAHRARTGWYGHSVPLSSAYYAGVVRADRRAVLYHLNIALLSILDETDQLAPLIARHIDR